MPWNKNSLTESLGLEYPVIQAPMAGGATTPSLIAAVSNQGGLGSLGGGYLSASELKDQIGKIRQLTSRPFSINLFAPEQYSASKDEMQKACDAINQCASELDVNAYPLHGPYEESFEEKINVLLDATPPIVSFTFGIPDKSIINELKRKRIMIIGTATSVPEAVYLEKNNIDAIVAQGSEAGGHRGTFLSVSEETLFPTNELTKNILEHVSLPVISSGGIMNGDTIGSLLMAGASGVQLGTAFLSCKESGIHPAYKNILINQKEDFTVLTRAFSGKLARGIDNKFTQCMSKKTDSIVDYPIQNKLTLGMRKKAKEIGNIDYMSLWAGQNVRLSRNTDVKKLFLDLVEETDSYFLSLRHDGSFC